MRDCFPLKWLPGNQGRSAHYIRVGSHRAFCWAGEDVVPNPSPGRGLQCSARAGQPWDSRISATAPLPSPPRITG